MKTKYLDAEIERLNLLEKNDELTDWGKEMLSELKEIKQVLHSVMKCNAHGEDDERNCEPEQGGCEEITDDESLNTLDDFDLVSKFDLKSYHSMKYKLTRVQKKSS